MAETNGGSTLNSVSAKAKRSRCKIKLKPENILLILTVLAVILGISVGVSIKFGVDREDPQLTPRQLAYLVFPGEIFLRMLKMLILPLIVSSLINSLTSLDSRTAGRMGLFATGFYMCTTLLAVITGIILVLAIRPGYFGDPIDTEQYADKRDNCKGTIPADTIMDLLRNVFPDNIVQAAFISYSTCVKKKTWITGENETVTKSVSWKDYEAINKTMMDTVYYDQPFGQSKSGMNILGLVVFSIVFGMIINRMDIDGLPLVHFFRALDGAMMKMVSIVIWVSPVGIFFLIVANIVAMDDLVKELKRLGMYMVTVIVGLLIHGGITLPLLLTFFGKKNPFKYIYGMLQALLTALGTASRVTRFMIPLGATINMDGTALYEAVAALYIAQSIRQTMNVGHVILISLTATLASIGAAGIPQAGLVTMIMVLIAVDLPPAMYTLIIPVDWFLDRIRTMINVHGDSVGAAVVENLCQKQLKQDDHDSQLGSRLASIRGSARGMELASPPLSNKPAAQNAASSRL